jgi:hypothetical protein
MDKKPTAPNLESFHIPNIMEEAAALTLHAKEEKNRQRKKTKTETTTDDDEKPCVNMIGHRITNLQELVASDTTHWLSQKMVARKCRKRHNQKKYRERVKLRVKATERAAELKEGISDTQKRRVDRIVNADSDDRDVETLKRIGNDIVKRQSMKTLQPGAWLSDEVTQNSSGALPS